MILLMGHLWVGMHLAVDTQHVLPTLLPTHGLDRMKSTLEDS